jgi:hypothetical protein
MIVRRPIACNPERNLGFTVLYFRDRDGPAGLPYYMMGSVCWPEPRPTGITEGYSLMAGQDVQTGLIVVFEEFSFATVNHWLNDTGGLVRLGLEQFLVDNWHTYRCGSYVIAQDEVTHKRHARQVWESKTISPVPDFIRVPMSEPVMTGILHSALDVGKFVGDTRSRLRQETEIYLNQPDLDTEPPSVRALKYLLAGYEHMPYTPVNERRPGKEVFV